MAGVMPDEPGLGEHDREKDGDEELPPGPPEHGKHGPPSGEQEQVQRDLGAVVRGPPPQQPGLLDGAGQLRVVASRDDGRETRCRPWVVACCQARIVSGQP